MELSSSAGTAIQGCGMGLPNPLQLHSEECTFVLIPFLLILRNGKAKRIPTPRNGEGDPIHSFNSG